MDNPSRRRAFAAACLGPPVTPPPHPSCHRQLPRVMAGLVKPNMPQRQRLLHGRRQCARLALATYRVGEPLIQALERLGDAHGGRKRVGRRATAAGVPEGLARPRKSGVHAKKAMQALQR